MQTKKHILFVRSIMYFLNIIRLFSVDKLLCDSVYKC